MNKLQLLTAASVFLSPFAANAALVWQSPMDGDATATVGPDGVAVGSPTATADRNGNPNGAVLFAGTNADNQHYNLGVISSTLGAGSMAFWVRNDDPTNDLGPIAMGVSGGGTAEYFTVQGRGDESWRADVDNGAFRYDAFDNDPPVTTGTWHHVAVTFAAGGNLTMYINGVAQTDVQALPADADLANLGDWLVGAERSTERQFIGALDDVYLYDNEISASEVATLAGIPEPATGALFGLAGLAMLRRRRGA